eukprot:5164007-Alexandrium_andersonii.AAC.1
MAWRCSAHLAAVPSYKLVPESTQQPCRQGLSPPVGQHQKRSSAGATRQQAAGAYLLQFPADSCSFMPWTLRGGCRPSDTLLKQAPLARAE